MITTMNAAYIAGLVDGEGCITIGHNKRTETYEVRVYIGMTEPGKSILTRLETQFGGSVKMARAATDRWANAYTWTVSGKRAHALLIHIVQYLQIKQQQARLAIFLHEYIQEHVPAGKSRAVWTDTLRTKAATVKCEISDLNQKGPELDYTPPITGAGLYARIVGEMALRPRQPDFFDPTGWEPFSESWPASGMTAHGVVWMLNTTEWPNADDGYSVSSLAETLESSVAPKYYLSPRACQGILRRAEKRGRMLPPQLEAVLRAVAQTDQDDEGMMI